MPRPPKRPTPKRRFVGGAGRRSLLLEYDSHLSKAKRAVGHGKTTNNVELKKAMQYLGLTPCEVGTECDVASLKSKGTLPKYMIANISCEPPGKHWVAYFRGYKYDPLGKDASNTAEQNDVETNCGQRCIAYLMMCKKKNRAIPL